MSSRGLIRIQQYGGRGKDMKRSIHTFNCTARPLTIFVLSVRNGRGGKMFWCTAISLPKFSLSPFCDHRCLFNSVQLWPLAECLRPINHRMPYFSILMLLPADDSHMCDLSNYHRCVFILRSFSTHSCLVLCPSKWNQVQSQLCLRHNMAT